MSINPLRTINKGIKSWQKEKAEESRAIAAAKRRAKQKEHELAEAERKRKLDAKIKAIEREPYERREREAKLKETAKKGLTALGKGVSSLGNDLAGKPAANGKAKQPKEQGFGDFVMNTNAYLYGTKKGKKKDDNWGF